MPKITQEKLAKDFCTKHWGNLDSARELLASLKASYDSLQPEAKLAVRKAFNL